jgi:hypothetical protein
LVTSTRVARGDKRARRPRGRVLSFVFHLRPQLTRPSLGASALQEGTAHSLPWNGSSLPPAESISGCWEFCRESTIHPPHLTWPRSLSTFLRSAPSEFMGADAMGGVHLLHHANCRSCLGQLTADAFVSPGLRIHKEEDHALRAPGSTSLRSSIRCTPASSQFLLSLRVLWPKPSQVRLSRAHLR